VPCYNALPCLFNSKTCGLQSGAVLAVGVDVPFHVRLQKGVQPGNATAAGYTSTSTSTLIALDHPQASEHPLIARADA
jgi:hypothetical protein